MKARNPLIAAVSILAFLLGLPIAANAEITIQNAHYNAEGEALYVKGKLTGDGVVRVFVIDLDHNRQIGAIDTYSKGLQFRADLPMPSSDAVPCMIRVQTTPLWNAFGFNPSFVFGGGEFTIATVQLSPERCGI